MKWQFFRKAHKTFPILISDPGMVRRSCRVVHGGDAARAAGRDPGAAPVQGPPRPARAGARCGRRRAGEGRCRELKWCPKPYS